MDEQIDNMYVQNIQIAELNALGVILAVMQMKKIFGFYHDFSKDNNLFY